MLHLAISGRETELRRVALHTLESGEEGIQPADVLYKAPTMLRFESVPARASLRRTILSAACKIEQGLTIGDVRQVRDHVGLLERFVGIWPQRWQLPVSVVHVARRFQKQAMDVGDCVAYPQPIRSISTNQPNPSQTQGNANGSSHVEPDEVVQTDASGAVMHSQSETTQFPCGLPASGVFQFNLKLGG
nr:hypothetical protein [Dyella sp. ASV24]